MPSQQDACYDAQAEVARGATYPTLASIQDHLDKLREEDWWPEDVHRVEVGPAADKIKSVGWFDPELGGGRIELTQRGMCQLTVLHELAHVLAMARAKSHTHDPVWVREFLTLTYRVMGTHAWVSLRAAFLKHGVVIDEETV